MSASSGVSLSSTFGRDRVSTPSSSLASAFSLSTLEGSMISR